MEQKRPRIALIAVLLTSAALAALRSASGGDSISSTDLKTWLTYIASDELQGRATYSAGLGLAASYIERHLREWGVEPGGDTQKVGTPSFLQTVRVQGVRSTS